MVKTTPKDGFWTDISEAQSLSTVTTPMYDPSSPRELLKRIEALEKRVEKVKDEGNGAFIIMLVLFWLSVLYTVLMTYTR